METTKNKLPDNVKQFFNNLSNYLETKLMYYGSIQRTDYLPGSSDIDVAIFTENEYSTIAKLEHYLKRQKHKFKKVVWELSSNKKIIYGYKVSYICPNDEFRAEFAIYNEKFKDDIVNLYKRKFDIPWLASIMLCILKFLFYKLHIITLDIFRYYKGIILSYGIGMPEELFIVLE